MRGVAAAQVGFVPETDEVPVILAGSVLTGADSPVTEALLAALQRSFPGARPRKAVLAPVFGVALDALAEADLEINPAVVDRMRQTSPRPGGSPDGMATADRHLVGGSAT